MVQEKKKEIIDNIILENKRRNDDINTKFNPITGEGSIGERFICNIEDFPIKTQFLPVAMKDVPLVKKLIKAGSVKKFLDNSHAMGTLDYETAKIMVVEQFVRVRIRHDFAFWAATYVYILSKIPGEGEILFRLTRPQRRFVEALEAKRTQNKPIRFVLLKARQWGGSTTSQLYMMWLQVVHKVGLNSVIVSQTKKTSFAIKAMFDRALNAYPISMLYRLGQQYNDNEKKIENVGLSGDYKRLPQRDCTITVASYESPDALRGDAYALVHCSEVGLWAPTDKKSPESVVRSACSGIAFRPYTMIIYESTANGTGNFFHREYLAAKEGKSQFDALFVSWKEIELYSLPFESEQQKAKFAEWLYDNRDNDYSPSEREENGKYLFSLWNDGATLEAINWYISERKKYTEHADMASEYPSNDIEAFTFSGRRVFPDEDIEQFRPACRQPRYIGEVYGKDDAGSEAMENLRFKNEKYGRLMMWDDVEHDDEEDVTERYLVVVDVCKGMSEKADWSVITVFDRLFMMDGLGPTVVAQWRGHIDMDMLAWKAAQIAEYYNHALLVIESNTLETNNTKGEAEYILTLIRDVYDNLYARKQSPEDIKEGRPRKYGYHTNVSTKKTIIHNLKAVLRDHLYTERDQGCLDEYATYIENEGRFEAPVGYHDDRLMTRAIGMQICFHEMGIPKIVKKENRNPNKPRRVVSAATI